MKRQKQFPFARPNSNSPSDPQFARKRLTSAEIIAARRIAYAAALEVLG